MPLNWCISFLMVLFLFFMMMLVYFEKYSNFNVFMDNYKDCVLNWKW